MEQQERIDNIKNGFLQLFDNSIMSNDTMRVYHDNYDACYIENMHNHALIAVVEKGTIKMKKSSYFTDYVLENIAKPYELDMRLLNDFSEAYILRPSSRKYPRYSNIYFSKSDKKFIISRR